MSARYGTLTNRRLVVIPAWPVVVVVAAMIALSIGIAITRNTAKVFVPVKTVTADEVARNSAAAVREQGATLPAIDLPSYLNSSTAALREQGATLPALDETAYLNSTAAVHEQGAVLGGDPQLSSPPAEHEQGPYAPAINTCGTAACRGWGG